MTWLHIKGVRTTMVKPDEETPVMTLVIPAHHVTSFKCGGGVRITKTTDPAPDIGVFAPVHAAPPGVVPLEEIQATLARLLASERN